MLLVSFADFDKIEGGELKLLRPSDMKLDQLFPLKAEAKLEQQFPLQVWRKGLYRASMQWTMNGRQYYYERLIVL
jgi:hypothetical protein